MTYQRTVAVLADEEGGRIEAVWEAWVRRDACKVCVCAADVAAGVEVPHGFACIDHRDGCECVAYLHRDARGVPRCVHA